MLPGALLGYFLSSGTSWRKEGIVSLDKESAASLSFLGIMLVPALSQFGPIL